MRDSKREEAPEPQGRKLHNLTQVHKAKFLNEKKLESISRRLKPMNSLSNEVWA